MNTAVQVSEGDELKQQGLRYVEENGKEFCRVMREHARSICLQKGWVTMDDLRLMADRIGLEPHHPNAWGAIFKGSEWRSTEMIKSQLPSNHGRMIRKWVHV